jgi:hypothetical protein
VPAAQEELAYTVHQDFALLQAQYRKRKSHMVFTMPISLLALRACVEQTFRCERMRREPVAAR